MPGDCLGIGGADGFLEDGKVGLLVGGLEVGGGDFGLAGDEGGDGERHFGGCGRLGCLEKKDWRVAGMIVE